MATRDRKNSIYEISSPLSTRERRESLYGKFSSKDEEYYNSAAWFLGPKGENSNLLRDAVIKSITTMANFRSKNYNRDDDEYITKEMKSSKEYKDAVKIFQENLDIINERLTRSVPFYSPRYQAHMVCDTSLPGIVGYIAALFYNQNNVTMEASTVTSTLELEVGNELCQLIGFNWKSTNIEPWGHITSCGTIANLESMWVARNIKYFPVALRSLLEMSTEYKKFKDIEMRVWPNQIKKPLNQLAREEILRLYSGDVLDFVETIANLRYPALYTKNPEEAITIVMNDCSPYTLQTLGIKEFIHKNPDINTKDTILVPVTRHYSWPKSATLLGLGEQSVIGVKVDNHCRMDIADLKEKLTTCAQEGHAVLMVVAVAGSTGEGAVDYLHEILKMRDEEHFLDMNYLIHVDAAWGGYLKTILPDLDYFYPMHNVTKPYVQTLPLSQHVQKQFRCLGLVDSVTIDPHKSGYIPYPAGCLCYRDGRFRHQINMSAPVFQSDKDLNVGTFGVEGSKPGAAAAAIWLSHKCIPLNQTGYGMILGECIFSVKIYHCYWLLLPNPDDPFVISMVHPLPKFDRIPFNTMNEDDIREYIGASIIGKQSEEVIANPFALYLLSEIGPDILINAFVFNFKNNDGSLNTSIEKINLLTSKILERYSIIKPPETIEDIVILIMATKYSSKDYQVVVDRMTKDLGLKPNPGEIYTLTILSSTILNPLPTVADFSISITSEFKKGLKEIIEEIRNSKS